MKFNFFSKKQSSKFTLVKKTSAGSFVKLSKKEQDEILKKGAEDFSIKFEKVMRELANG